MKAEYDASDYTFAWVARLAELDRREWDALAAANPSPFLEWGWLTALEESGSIAPARGWTPVHLTVRKAGTLAAAAPLYVKTNSDGEFVFDYAWADVASRLGVRYYPKLVGMSPATPVMSYRFLFSPAEDEERLTGAMLSRIGSFCSENRLSGCSFNFADSEWQERLSAAGFTRWKHHGFVWENPGFGSFEDYLSVFTKNQRRNIRRERASVTDQGITIRVLAGTEIPDSYFPLMHRYYENTNRQFGPWAAKFLNRKFFDEVRERYRDRLVFVAAYRGSEVPVALSFLVRKADRLYGRYWGADRFYPDLYFNVCYYSPIEWAIGQGIRRFDPGMGASLKVRRGFLSTYSYSLHRFTNPLLQQVMESYIGQINEAEQDQIDELNAALPFKREVLEKILADRER
jgi:predicted N-acyltransferase